MVMQFSSCCCGCSLRTGTIILGVIEAISAFFSVIILSVAANGLLQLSSADIIAALNQTTPLLDPNSETPSQLDETAKLFAQGAAIIFIIIAVLSSIRLIFSIMLVFGTSSNRPGLIKPWIVYAITMLSIAIVLYLALMILYFKYGHTTEGIVLLISSFVGGAIEVYFILVVNSFHTELLRNVH